MGPRAGGSGRARPSFRGTPGCTLTPSVATALANAYPIIKARVLAAGFASEIDWMGGLRFADLTESHFLREAAWVVMSAGMPCGQMCQPWQWVFPLDPAERVAFAGLPAPIVAVALDTRPEVRSSNVGWNVTSPEALMGGLPIVTLDYATGMPLAVMRSEMEAGSEPLDTWAPALASVTSTEGAPQLAAFGGVRADGTASDALWLGSRVEGGCIGQTCGPGSTESYYLWTAVDVPGARPEPRGAAVLVGEPARGRLILLGGWTPTGEQLTDLWTFSLSDRYWTRAPGAYDVPPDAASTRTEDAIYFFGGTREDAVATLMRLDLLSLELQDLSVPDATWPSARADAALSYDAARGRLLLYGGRSGDEGLQDVWGYSLADGTWSVVWPGCGASGCPPAGVGGGVWVTPGAELIAVPAVTSRSTPERAFRLGPDGWAGAVEAVQGVGVGSYDCDGDTVPEPRYGLMCSVGDWWAPAGKLRCGDSGLACAGPLVQPGAAVAELRTARPQAVALLEEGKVAVLGGRGGTKVDLYLRSGAGVWQRASTIALPWKGRALAATSDGDLLVAGDHHLAVYDVSSGLGGLRQVLPLLEGTPWDVRAAGSRAAVATGAGLVVLERGTTGLWEAKSAARAKLLAPGQWEQVPAAGASAMALEAHNASRARALGWDLGVGAHLALSGRRAFVTYGRDVIAWELTSGTPRLRGALTTGDDLAAVQARGAVAYAWGVTGHPVVEVAADGSLKSLGQHDLALAQRHGHMAARVTGKSAEVANVP